MSTTSTLRPLTQCALFVVLIAICSWISIPFSVPFTMQTFAVFSALLFLGGKQGSRCMVCYLLLGAVGIPVFSGFRGGLGALMGTTGGYILGFLLSALLYWLLTALLGQSLWVRICAVVLGLLSCYAFGTLWYVFVYTSTVGAIGWYTALTWCVFPFVLPDICKMALAFWLHHKLSPLLP